MVSGARPSITLDQASDRVSPIGAMETVGVYDAELAPRLGQLRSGDVATVGGLDSSQLAAKRLADLGFIPGVQIEMLRPGRPCLVRVNGSCLGLGRSHQESIVLSALAPK